MDLSNIEWPSRIFVTGIGTDVGKSYATGWLARELNDNGISCTTQKLIQTGNKDFSEDIAIHRKIMGIDLTEDDLAHTTAPVIFSYPASPHLAAMIDKKEIDFSIIDSASDVLCKKYHTVIIEGAGGLMVPLKNDYLTVDYICDHCLPTILVTGGQLGSINHALLSLEAIRIRGIKLFGIIYNPFFDKDKTICDDTKKYLLNWMKERFPGSLWLEMPNSPL
ncbi:MAG: dethiobiotin synthase [Muribaculaceae bacterium]|nr:dethiobiotin synthase [Muribaculaceae bacterium]